jgi:hypothetical protein
MPETGLKRLPAWPSESRRYCFQTAMQTSVPPEALAHVTTFDLLGSEDGQPIGYALADPLGASIGARTYLTYSAAGIPPLSAHVRISPGALHLPARGPGPPDGHDRRVGR